MGQAVQEKKTTTKLTEIRYNSSGGAQTQNKLAQYQESGRYLLSLSDHYKIKSNKVLVYAQKRESFRTERK